MPEIVEVTRRTPRFGMGTVIAFAAMGFVAGSFAGGIAAAATVEATFAAETDQWHERADVAGHDATNCAAQAASLTDASQSLLLSMQALVDGDEAEATDLLNEANSFISDAAEIQCPQ